MLEKHWPGLIQSTPQDSSTESVTAQVKANININIKEERRK